MSSPKPGALLLPAVRASLTRLADYVESRRDEVLRWRVAGEREGNASDSIVESLSAWLYSSWYSVPDIPGPAPRIVPGRGNLAAALRASIPACTRWQSGWVVVQSAPDGSCVAGKDGQTRALRAGEFANVARPGLPVMPGDTIAAPELLTWVDKEKGFFCAQSFSGEPAPPLVRVYWSAIQDQIGFVLKEVLEMLDRLAVSFALKCPERAAEYTRVDTLVVYLNHEAWDSVASFVAETAHKVREHLRDSIPPLTLQIARGVAFAEDPNDGQSFGQSRCHVLASAMLTLLDGNSSRDAVMVFAEALGNAGIDLDCPWKRAMPRATPGAMPGEMP